MPVNRSNNACNMNGDLTKIKKSNEQKNAWGRYCCIGKNKANVQTKEINKQMMHYGYSKQHYIAYNKGTFFLNKMKKKDKIENKCD